jgi:LuxR family maltose regulon positive regulatory protein
MADLLRLRLRRAGHAATIDRILAAAAPAPPPSAARRVWAGGAHGPANLDVDALTYRERDVLGLLQQRLSYKEIAQAMVLSPLTVKAHASNIYSKLGVSGRREAIRKAESAGLLPRS